MKKLLALLVLLSMSFTTCFAATPLFPDGDNTLASSFTDKILDDDHYVKYDAETDAVISYATSNSNCQGILAFPEEYTDGSVTIGFTTKANSNIHRRSKLYFDDKSGNRFFTMFALGSATTFYLTDTTNSRYDTSFKDRAIGEEVRVEVKFDFTNANFSVRLGQKIGDDWSFNSWTAKKSITAGATGLKKLVISNEWAVSDVSFYDIAVTESESEQPDVTPTPDVTPKPEDPDQPEEPADYNSTIYERIFRQDFSDDNISLNLSGTAVDSDHYIAVDSKAGKLHAYNGNGSGGQGATIKFDKTIATDGSKIAFTMKGTEDHARMKLQFLNSENKQIHTLFVLKVASANKIAITDKTNSQFRDENGKYLTNTDYNTPLRIEMEFNFTDKTVTYRAAKITDDGYDFSSITPTKAFLPEAVGATKFDVSAVQVDSRYAKCDATIDNLDVYVPKLTVSKSAANTDEYFVTYTIVNNTADAITTDIICVVYDENGAVDEVKCLKNAKISSSLSDMFMFDYAEDVSNYKIFIWNKLGDLVPVSMGYQSF